MSLFDQLISMAIVMGLVHTIRYFDLASQENIFFVRILYFISQGIQVLLSLLALMIVFKKNENTTKIVVTDPKNPFSDESPSSTEMTIQQYDRMKISEIIKQCFIHCALMLFLHFKFGYIQPLILQSVLTIKTYFTTPIIKIHILNFLPVGDLSRPFKPPVSPFAALFQADSDESSSKTEEQGSIDNVVLEKTVEQSETTLDSSPHNEKLKIRKKLINVK